MTVQPVRSVEGEEDFREYYNCFFNKYYNLPSNQAGPQYIIQYNVLTFSYFKIKGYFFLDSISLFSDSNIVTKMFKSLFPVINSHSRSSVHYPLLIDYFNNYQN